MRHSTGIANVLGALALAVGAAAANAGVVVSFPGSDQYTDARPDGSDSASALRGIERHLQALGKRYLTPQQTLRIEVLDIDLAGRLEFTRGAQRVRILKDNGDGPVVQLRYTLESGGTVLASGEEIVTDRAYMTLRSDVRSDGAPLYYEKRMLGEWFKSRFVARPRS